MKLALPNYKNAPAIAGKRLQVLSVPRLVAIQLGQPIVKPGLRQSAALGVAMPETTVHEDDRMARRENEVRFAREIAAVKPIAKAKRVNETANEHFRLSVFSANARHALAAGTFGKRIGHATVL
jgi:hypothetical protein